MKRILCSLSFAFILSAAGTGCTDATMSHYGAYGSNHIVMVWSGGKAVKTYVSSGQVKSENQSDGFFFKDKSTGKLVRVSGTLTIEQE